MSRLEELIQELCPNGVEYKPLWFLTIWDKKFNSVDRHKQTKVIKYKYYLAADLKGLESQTGDVKILTTSISDLWTTEEYVKDTMSEGEIVCIPWGGNPVVQYYSGKFVTGDNRIATSANTSVLSNKFLYYFMQNSISDIASFYRGSGIKHPDMAKVLDLMIPVPPLEVQREIVRILDSFTLLTAELTAELTARKKQYEYYRNHLLTYDASVKVQTLGEVCNISAGGDAPKEVMTKEMTEKFSIPIISNGIGENALYGYTNIAKINTPAVTIAARGTIGYAEYRDYPYFPIIRLLSAIPKDTSVVDTKYLYYCLKGKQYSVPMGGIPQLTAPKLKNVKIPVPNIEEQQSIVDILDRFDSLCNDISIGLPAEIEARQKQYEFYRDKLLSFKQL